MYMKKYTYMTDRLYCGCLGEVVGGGWWVVGVGEGGILILSLSWGGGEGTNHSIHNV